MSGWSRGWLVALAVALTLHAACTGDDSDDDSSVITDPIETTDSTTSTSSSSTTETTADPQAEVEAEVEAAYLAYDVAYLDIFGEPDPENPLIDQLTTGAVKEATLDSIAEYVLKGQSIRAPDDPANLRTTVLDVTANESAPSATLQACLIDGTVLVDNSTGAVVNDNVATLLVDVVLRKEGSTWKVAESNVADRREGRWDCAT